MSSTDLIRDFQTLGCKDDLKCAMASMVYLDLKDDPRVTNVERCYDEQLDLIYFSGQRENSESKVVIVPISSCSEIDMDKMEEIQSKLNSESKSITMAACDPSSTILYYNITNDFVEKV